MSSGITKYEVIIYWSEEDKSFIAEVPELTGCMSDGPTPHDALENVQEIISQWIDTAVSLGRPIPEPKGRLKYA
jgi:predicted RNase H-like HicB family nuclease